MNTIVSALASVGGMWKVITTIVYLIVKPFQEFSFHQRLIKRVFLTENEEKTDKLIKKNTASQTQKNQFLLRRTSFKVEGDRKDSNQMKSVNEYFDVIQLIFNRKPFVYGTKEAFINWLRLNFFCCKKKSVLKYELFQVGKQ